MQLRLYNTLSRSVEPFAPIEPGHARIYVCGLTPSAEAHLGHARSFMFFDVLRRYLVYRGLRVTFVQNVTDIDDRSIATARAEGTTYREVVDRFLGSFKASMRKLHVTEPDHEPRATGFIPEIVGMIERLIERGLAYVAADGVYYSVKKFPRYGALSHRNVDELLIGARIEPGEAKADPLDFALWKLAKEGEPSWPSPWGAGRPGWHIECSAMSEALLGVPLDIHGGGFDLVFPHHENEIAQSEPLMDHPPLSRFWVHGGLLAFDGRKMSKSLGNFEPLSSLLERHDPQAIRLLLMQTGYRKPMDFTEASIGGATSGLRRLYDAYDALRSAPPAAATHEGKERVRTWRERFEAALDDDMNTAGAASMLFEIAAAAPALLTAGDGAEAAAFMHEAMGVLGISPNERTLPKKTAAGAEALGADFVQRLRAHVDGAVTLADGEAAAAIEAVIAARGAAKAARDFGRADALRDALAAVGVALKDGKDGTTWSVAG
jgi:cysteinyl-tRNA synthetase